MPNLQLCLTTTHTQAEHCADILSALGALSVTLLDAKVGTEEQPIFEPLPGTTPLWAQTQVVALFELEVDINAIKTILQTQLDKKTFETWSIGLLADQKWESVCMDQFHPMQFGQHLWICPSWEAPPNPAAINILLDPGLAFGTGTHPTTRLCLEWLDAHPPLAQTVLDYGCGSGILGIAALKLGATEVYAIDHDPQALDSTQDNAQKNGFRAPKIRTLLPKDFATNAAFAQNKSPFDLILANILANPLMDLAPQFATWLKPNGQLVLSGLLLNQIEAILTVYAPWFHQAQVHTLDEWCRIDFTAKKVN